MVEKEYKLVAFLRGINVSGHKKVPMQELKKLLEKNKYQNVATLLASGNVLFSSSKKNPQKDLEKLLEQHFGFTVPVIITTQTDIAQLVEKNPFPKSTQKNLKYHVSFIKGKDPLFHTVDLDTEKTVDLMPKLKKEYGTEVTTRTWQTIEKLHSKIQQQNAKA